MSELGDLVLEAVEAHLPSRDIVATMGSNGLRIPLLKIAIRVHDVEEIPRKDQVHAISVIMQVGSLDSINGGIDVLHTGMGDTLEEAAANAAHQWITGVLPVVYSYLTHRDREDVGHSQMIVAIEDTGEQFGWSVHLGPIVTRVFGDLEQPEELGKSEIFKRIFNVVHPFAAHTTLFWLECFAVRYPDGRIDATCRKHNDDWEEGKQALLVWASEWPVREKGFVSQRQFIIFEPTAVKDLKSGEELARRLPLPKKKPWWRLW
jgi:hypothetical protein